MNTWAKLSAINVNQHVEKKSGLSYLSWAWAWGLTKEKCPDASYRVINFDGKPYCFDEHLGYMVQTEVTIDGETLPMHLFVMDGANKAQRHIDYTYRTKSGEKSVVAATMFDINTAIMRCLTKNLAMFGLGHYIYAGEDLPHESDESKQARFNNDVLFWTSEIEKQSNLDSLNELWKAIPTEYKKSVQAKASEMKLKFSPIQTEEAA